MPNLYSSPTFATDDSARDLERDLFLSELEWEVKARLAGYGTPLLQAWRDHPHFPPAPLTDCLKASWRQLAEVEKKAAGARLRALLLEVLADREPEAEEVLAERARGRFEEEGGLG